MPPEEISAARHAAVCGQADLDWWHRISDAPASVVKRQRRAVAKWHRDNPLDVDKIIRSMRNNEDNRNRGGGRALSV